MLGNDILPQEEPSNNPINDFFTRLRALLEFGELLCQAHIENTDNLVHAHNRAYNAINGLQSLLESKELENAILPKVNRRALRLSQIKIDGLELCTELEKELAGEL